MEVSNLLNAIFILLLTSLSIYLLLFIAKKITQNHSFQRNSSIKIIEAQFIDPKRRIVKIEHKNKEFLVLVGNQEILLDTYEK